MDELDIARLKQKAAEASSFAYCPYSRFPVGAAVLGASGRIYAACNIENASYSLTLCAERNAIGHAIAAGEKKLTALVLYTPTPEPKTPCGACRQVLIEFGEGARVICTSNGTSTLEFTAEELLPKSFAL
jgi:cytidine deaminase